MSLLISCPVCEEKFWPSANKVYCSDSCREKSKRARRKDEIKKAVYEWRKNNRDKINQRQRELRSLKPKPERIKQTVEERRLRNMAYHDKVRFSGNRELTLQRDGYKCTSCESTKQLDVHHIDKSGQTENPNNELSNLVTLCKPCHQLQHKHDRGRTGQQILCKYCGKETFALKKEIGRKKYCSLDCSDKDKVGKFKTSEQRECEVCKNPFKATKQAIEQGKGRYCSPECSQSAQRKTVKVNCITCGTEFNTIPAVIAKGKGKFCSKPCYHKSKIKSN